MEDGMKTDAGHDVRRVLDEGVVIAGEVQIQLLGLKLLPVKVKLLIASAQFAEATGLNWWPAKGRREAPARKDRRDVPAATARNGETRPRVRRKAGRE